MAKLWFLERGIDGEILPMDEKTAYNVLHPNNWQRRDFKIIGVCEARMWAPKSVRGNSEYPVDSLCGEEYIRVYEEGEDMVDTITPELKKNKEIRERYLIALEKLMFEEFLDENDERVKRANALIDGINVKVDDLTAKISAIKGDLHKKALEAQISACRGNIIQPDRFSSIVTAPGASPRDLEKIKGMMNV